MDDLVDRSINGWFSRSINQWILQTETWNYAKNSSMNTESPPTHVEFLLLCKSCQTFVQRHKSPWVEKVSELKQGCCHGESQGGKFCLRFSVPCAFCAMRLATVSTQGLCFVCKKYFRRFLKFCLIYWTFQSIIVRLIDWLIDWLFVRLIDWSFEFKSKISFLFFSMTALLCDVEITARTLGCVICVCLRRGVWILYFLLFSFDPFTVNFARNGREETNHTTVLQALCFSARFSSSAAPANPAFLTLSPREEKIFLPKNFAFSSRLST